MCNNVDDDNTHDESSSHEHSVTFHMDYENEEERPHISPLSIETTESSSSSSSSSTRIQTYLSHIGCSTLATTHILKVASVTMANGSDNIGIYIPLFASSNSIEISIILIVFFIFVFIWLGISYGLLYVPGMRKMI